MHDQLPFEEPGPEEALERASSRLHSALELDDALGAVLDELRQFLMAEAASIALKTSDGGASYVAARGAGARQTVGQRVPPGEGIVGWVLEHGELDVTGDAVHDPRHSVDVDRLAQTQTRSIVTEELGQSVPLWG